MAELVDWLHHESITRAATNTANSTIGQPFGNGGDVCPVCGKPSTIGKPQTNGDRIRQMSDEELAEWIAKVQQDVADYYCSQCTLSVYFPTMKDSWIAWLGLEAEDLR